MIILLKSPSHMQILVLTFSLFVVFGLLQLLFICLSWNSFFSSLFSWFLMFYCHHHQFLGCFKDFHHYVLISFLPFLFSSSFKQTALLCKIYIFRFYYYYYYFIICTHVTRTLQNDIIS